MIFRRAGLALALALVPAALVPAALVSPAIAEPTREDRAAALALFDEGRKLAADTKFAEACPKFEASMRLDPGMGTLFNLSDCYEQIGRVASAWQGFRDVAMQAKAANQAEREKVARDRAAALEGKVPRVRVVVPADLAGVALTITRDGVAFSASLVGTPIQLDPGPHTFRVTAEGREPWEKTVTLAPNGATIELLVPSLGQGSGPGPQPTTSAGPAASGSAPAASGSASAAPSATTTAAPASTAAPGPGSPRPWQRPLGITATALGAVGLGVGIALGVVGKGTYDQSNEELCTAGTPTCKNQEGVDLRNKAVEQGNIGTVVGVIGSVIGAAGIIVWITAPSAPSAPASPAKSAGVTSVRVGAAPGALVIRGQF